MGRAHGWSGYCGGCRCDVCKAANTDRSRARRRSAKIKVDSVTVGLGPEASVGLSIASALEGRTPAELVTELVEQAFGGLGAVELEVPDHGMTREQRAWAEKRWPAMTDRQREQRFRGLST